MFYDLTKHAEIRGQQRGFRTGDLDLIIEYGTPTREGIMLTKKDAQCAISEIQAEAKYKTQRVERLKNTFAPVAGNKVLTMQRARKWKQNRELRGPRRNRKQVRKS